MRLRSILKKQKLKLLKTNDKRKYHKQEQFYFSVWDVNIVKLTLVIKMR